MGPRQKMLGLQGISIHALRKECDMGPRQKMLGLQGISIHALRKECDGYSV